MSGEAFGKSVEILLVEDNPADVLLTRQALRDIKIRNCLSVAEDGVEAMMFLRREGKFSGAPRPDIVLLDLNLPRMDGAEVLAAVKGDEDLKCIPIVVLSSSQAEEDIVRSYRLNANCYVSKPVDFDQFMRVVRSIEDFWLTVARLPRS